MIMINNIKVPIGRAYINDVKMCWAKLGED